MGNHRSSYRRDNAILSAVERHGVLDAEQLEVLFFKHLKSGKRVCQRRLEVLSEKQLNRDRRSFAQPYFYYFGKVPGQVEHRLAVNWVYIWLVRGLKSWEQIHSLEYEVAYKAFRVDALVAVKNKVTGRLKVYYIEADRSDNEFRKVLQLNVFYQSGAYRDAWWVPLADRFPVTVVATETDKRHRHITEKINTENPGGLEFRLLCLSDIRGGCLGTDKA